MPAPHFPTVKKNARTRPVVLMARKPRQQRSAPYLRHGGEEKEQRRVLGRINADVALHAGLGPATNAKPGVILMRRQSANRPSGVIAFASALAQSTPSSG
jgi:hypothetical protein